MASDHGSGSVVTDDAPVVLRSKDDVVQIVASGRAVSQRSWLIVLIALGGVFIDAYDFTSLGIGVTQLKAQFHLNPAQVGSVTAAMAIGTFVAAFFGGYYVDRVGRFKAFLLDLFFFIISALLSALSPNLIWLLIFRFFMGVGVGLDFPVALSFIAEFTALKRRGATLNTWILTWYVAATVGFLVVIPTYFIVGVDNLWRWAVGFGAVPALIVLILRFMYMDESPLWAANTGNLQEAARILRKTYGINAQVDPDYRAQKHHVALRDIAQVFAPRYRQRTILAVAISMTQSMEYYALNFYLPTISLLIFGNQFIWALIGSAFFNLFGIVGGTLNFVFLPRWGVRRVAILGYIGGIVALVLIGGFGKALPVALAGFGIALFILSHGFGPGGAGMTTSALSFPTAIRGIGTGFTQSLLRVGSTMGFYFFPLLLAAVGLYPTLLLLAIVPFVGLLVTLVIKWDPVQQNINVDEEEAKPALEGVSTGMA